MYLLKIKYLDYFVALGVYFTISFLVLGGIILSPGTIGFFHDWFIGPYHEMNESLASDGLYVWNTQEGNKVYGTDWIFRLSLLPLPFLGGELLSKGLLILIITMSGFGAFCLGKRLQLNPYVSFAAGILYIFSPIIFTRIIAGHLYYLIAYFLSPLILANFLKGKEENSNRYFVIAGLLLSFAVIQVQFLVLALVTLLIFTLLDFTQIKKGVVGLFIITSITFLIIFSPILLPQLLVKGLELPFNAVKLLSYHSLVSASDLAKSFRILGYEDQPYSYLNLGTPDKLFASNEGIIPSWIFYLDFLIPIIGFSVLLFRRDKYTISFAIISIIGIFLLKGLNPPFPGVFEFLFVHGFYLFREIWHVAFLYSFCITFLMAFFIEGILLLKKKLLFKVCISVALILIVVISNGYPLFFENFAGNVQTYSLSSGYQTLYNKISTDTQYNVLILPYINPIRYDNLSLSGVDPFVVHSTMIFPQFSGGTASATEAASTWLLSSIQYDKTEHLGNVLSGFGIKYVILRKDFVSNYPDYTPLASLSGFRERWNTPLEPILDSQKDMKIISDNSQFKIYKNLNNATKIFVSTTSGGGLSDFDSLFSISNLTPLSNVALYPSVSDSDSLVFIDNIDETNMPVNDFVEIGNYVYSFDAKEGWTDNINSFGYDHILSSRVNNGAFTASPNSEISFELPANYTSKHVEIWMKALRWDQGGSINVKINGQEHTPSLFSSGRSFGLFKVFEGESDAPYHVSIRNIEGKNYVEGLYVKEKALNLNSSINNKTIPISALRQKLPNLIPNSDFSIVDNKSKLPLYWNVVSNICGSIHTCEINVTDGWDDKQSFQVSTTNNTNNTWSGIEGGEIDIKSNEWYELVTHMKQNKPTTQSHVTLEGFNETSRQWYQVTQCPTGVSGPMDWKEFSCTIRVPENTTKIRHVLNAGWSLEPKKVSRTWFDALSLTKLNDENEFPRSTSINNKTIPISDLHQKPPNLIANSDFSIADNKSKLPLYWNDSLNRCDRYFSCKVNNTEGWDDKQSFRFSTRYPHNVSGIWSSTYGQQIEVKPNEQYELITHMKLNRPATQSHVTLEGFNETSRQWYQVTQCPTGVSGPMDWKEFSCTIRVPENTTKIRHVLNAGWSLEPKKVSRTWFDALSLTKLNDENESPYLAQIKKLIMPEIVDNKSSIIKEFNKVNPTLWNVHIDTYRPTTIAFAEPYHQSWEAAVYKDGKKIDVVKSMPLYGAINAFPIKQTGNLDIVLSFAPQYWYQVGLVISGITFVFCIFYIVYDWRRNKNRKSQSSSITNRL